MKRVNAIVNSKNVTKDALERKANRITRQVAQAIDAAKDNLSDLEDQAEDVINSLGACSDASSTGALQCKFNKYIDLFENILAVKNAILALTELQAKLDADVEVVEG